jgi:hypothetical protein
VDRSLTTRVSLMFKWGEKKLVMFYEDIQTRGDLVKGKPT